MIYVFGVLAGCIFWPPTAAASVPMGPINLDLNVAQNMSSDEYAVSGASDVNLNFVAFTLRNSESCDVLQQFEAIPPPETTNITVSGNNSTGKVSHFQCFLYYFLVHWRSLK